MSGTKESAVLLTAPFLEKGWAVVNVRSTGWQEISLAPAAVEDQAAAPWHWV